MKTLLEIAESLLPHAERKVAAQALVRALKGDGTIDEVMEAYAGYRLMHDSADRSLMWCARTAQAIERSDALETAETRRVDNLLDIARSQVADMLRHVGHGDSLYECYATIVLDQKCFDDLEDLMDNAHNTLPSLGSEYDAVAIHALSSLHTARVMKIRCREILDKFLET